MRTTALLAVLLLAAAPAASEPITRQPLPVLEGHKPAVLSEMATGTEADPHPSPRHWEFTLFPGGAQPGLVSPNLMSEEGCKARATGAVSAPVAAKGYSTLAWAATCTHVLTGQSFFFGNP